MRIVSLLASGTELVHALGAGSELVGRSHECDFPEEVRKLPCCTAPTFDVTGDSRQIDTLVNQLLRAGKPLYRIDGELLARLEPDLLITQAHCEVCAVSPADISRDTQKLEKPVTLGTSGVMTSQVVALRTGTLDDILEGFLAVAQAMGRSEAGRQLVETHRGKLAQARLRIQDLPRPGVVCLEWIDPVFTMGNWGPELVEYAGGRSLLGEVGVHSKATPWERVRAANPEVLVVAPCGFAIERTLKEMRVLEGQPGWRDLRAVREGKVIVADGNLYFNRSGPNMFDTVDLLTEILHPGLLAPRFYGDWWRYFPER